MSSWTTPPGSGARARPRTPAARACSAPSGPTSSQRKRVTCVRRRGRRNVRARNAAGQVPAGVEAVDVAGREVRARAVERAAAGARTPPAAAVVGVEEHEELAAGARATPALRAAPRPPLLLADEPEARVAPRRTRAAIAAAPSGEPSSTMRDLEVGERLRAQRREALVEVGLDAVDRHDDADPRHRPYRGGPRGARRAQPPRPRLAPPAAARRAGDRAAPGRAARRAPAPARRGARPRSRARSGSCSPTPMRWAAPCARR